LRFLLITVCLLGISNASFGQRVYYLPDPGASYDSQGNAILTPQQLFHRCMIVAAKSIFSNGTNTVQDSPQNKDVAKACRTVKTFPALKCVRLTRQKYLGPKLTINNPGWYARENEPLDPSLVYACARVSYWADPSQSASDDYAFGSEEALPRQK
jgi:hypothetical protein